MNVQHIKRMICKLGCNPEDRKLVIEALDELLQYGDDINDIKSGMGYMSIKIKGLERKINASSRKA